MGHSQAEKLATHQRIVDVAAKRFRELGLEGISVADVMAEAGLTVGGFYKHFESRDHLVVEALAAALSDAHAPEATARPNLKKWIRAYLSVLHRDTPTDGCALSSLVNDVSRSSEDVKEAYSVGLAKQFEIVEKALPPHVTDERRKKAILIFSACVGALSLSRAVADKKLSDRILDGVAEQLVDLFASPKAIV
ncbi:TetR/AcrR family transcriptional regulator [Paraburkholderia strydomiana]